ncbi:hypothetical protein OF364_00755 [Mycoplasma enhydrae]|uniref:MAG0490 family ComEA-like DNA-binding protein n=1 Tax=Mycoplasma enhydrae TaxID=2499220 RepID=UPI0021E79AF4|nr:hypothetical protein [Mycoplasma enhydrae]MCV3753348.1 hypothetical protein [Mycoplasma enhydrae]
MKIKLNKKKLALGLSLFLVSSSILIGGIITKTQIIDKLKPNANKEIEDKYITVKVSGAIKYPGEYSIKKGSTYQDVFKECILLSGAELSGINRQEVLLENKNIYIPFLKDRKLKLSDITNAEILIKIGLKPGIAKKVFDYLKDNKIISWDEVLKIPGVGEKTYLLLTKNIAI